MLLGSAGCGEESDVAVPNVVGMDYAKAISSLAKESFAAEAKDETGKMVTTGKVESQEPKAGTKAKKGSKVTLTVTVGADTRPSYSKEQAQALVGKNGTDAISELESKNVLGNVYIENDLQKGTNKVQQVKDDTAAGIAYIVTGATYHSWTNGKVDITVDTVAHHEAVEKTKVDASTGAAIVTACDAAGDQQFPYGYKPESVAGVLQPPMKKDDGTYFYKLQAKVRNQYKAERKVTVECTTTGDQNGMQVTGFNAY
jgi:hypothetical protein